MRWTIVILVLVGVVAAVSAAMLAGTMRADAFRTSRLYPSGKATSNVMVAKRSLPAMTIVDAAAVESRPIATDDTPAGALAEPTQVIGKVLAVPVVEGQALTRAVFVPEGSGVQLASQLPLGMRAVAVTVSDAGGLRGILYPGCLVDVLVAINRRVMGDEAPATISTTLLENIAVLAVDLDTIVSPRQETKTEAIESPLRTRKETLRVDAEQAKALQLAQDVGTLILALRNPSDKETHPEAVPVSLRVLAGGDVPPRGALPERPLPAALVAVTPPTMAPSTTPPAAAAPATAPVVRASQWETTIIRGGASETRRFVMPAGEQAKD